jgi:hypothetical protein
MSAFELKDILEYAWQYFELHAKQRIAVFNFYIVVAGFLTTTIAASFSETKHMHLVGIVLGITLSVMSFIFWKLDTRTKALIKNSENALKRIEHKFPTLQSQADPRVTQLFLFDAFLTSSDTTSSRNPFSKSMTYSDCFNSTFLLFGVFGLVSAVMLIAIC